MNTQPELDFVRDALPELESYLLSQEIFWPMGGNQPRLTLGGMRLSLRRLHALAASPTEQSTLSRLIVQVEAAHTRWRAAWEQKAARELRTRLTLWQNYLGDYRLNPENYAGDYPHEVRLRVIIDLLLADLPSPAPESLALLQGLDEQLRAAFIPGNFAWEADLAEEFPQPAYWYLYGTLRSENAK
ncbi:MAG: hypothetical protein WHV44_11320 [Anaerolineales bacterium]